jgi:branched-chain amino acid transport system permease protein
MEFFVQQLANGVMAGSIYVMITLGLVLVLSMMDVVNFAHGQIAMVGAYIILFVQNASGMDFWPSLVITIIMVGIIGFIIEKGVIRQTRIRKLPIMIAALATIGLSMILEELIVIAFGRNPESVTNAFGRTPVEIGFLSMSLMRIIIPAIMVVAVLLLLYFLYRVKMGRGLRAVAQDADAASLQGINVDLAMSVGFIISCCLASLAGACLAQMIPITPYMGMTYSLKAFSIIVVGGMMSLPGAIVTSFIMGIGEAMMGGYVGGGYQEVFFFAAMVIILIIRRDGLFGSTIR